MGYNPTVTIYFGGQTEKAHSSNDVNNQSRGTHWVLHVHKGKPTMLSSFAGTDQFDQLGCDLVQGQDKINIACFDGRLRHAEILRTGPVLCNHHAARGCRAGQAKSHASKPSVAGGPVNGNRGGYWR